MARGSAYAAAAPHSVFEKDPGSPCPNGSPGVVAIAPTGRWWICAVSALTVRRNEGDWLISATSIW